jgi:Zn-dependent metalloprotease
MCQSTPHRHPIFCIIPPNVLENVAQNGNAQQRAEAINTLAVSQTIRAIRASAPPPRRRSRSPQPRDLGSGPEKQRSIFDAHGETNLPGTLIRAEGAPSNGDVSADEAYDGLGATWDFFFDVFERNSINDEGMPLMGVVHFGQKFDNAFWDSKEMVFGDGNLFARFTSSLDVIGHELTHGVVEDETGLLYFMQSGALNESLSDVFGVMVKQKLRKLKVDKSDWLIGKELFDGTNLQGDALRSMKAPGTAFDDPLLGKDPQPGHMRDFVRTFKDNGGVHINSGIPNRAFYLAATALGGYAWEKAGRIWYTTMLDSQIRPNTGFIRFAKRSVVNAGTLYGIGSTEQQAVIDAWKQVGITPM